jgi:hypothetical protein
VLGTYRPVDVIMRDHPLRRVKQELQLHGLCQELPLALLSEVAVGEYLTRRFDDAATGGSRFQSLAKAIHRRTDGNPLFMVTTVEDLIAQHVLVKDGEQWVVQEQLATVDTTVPNTLQQLIEEQIERLSAEDRLILEIASVAGMEFSAAAVAAGVAIAAEAIEEQCAGLARQGRFLQTQNREDWPDGTVAASYRFLHALYQEVLYQRLPAGRRQRLHQHIGERKEHAYGERAREIATELAVHFEQGRDYRKAVQYLQYAGENAMRRSAHQEALQHFTKGLEVLKALPDTPERIQQELTLQLARNGALTLAKGFTAPEVKQAVMRARELCQQLGNPPQLFAAVLGSLYMLYQNRGELQATREVAEQLLRLAQNSKNQHLLVVAHTMLVGTLYWLGEFTSAQPHQEQVFALYDPQRDSRRYAVLPDPRVQCLYYASVTLWHLGYPDQALKKSQDAITLATGLSHPFILAQALGFAAQFHSLRQEWQLARARAEEVITLSTEQGFPFWLAQGKIIRGGALVEQEEMEEGIAQLEQGLANLRTIGAELVRTALLPILAAAYAKANRIADGLSAVTEALVFVDKIGEHFSEAELYRLKGELTLRMGEKAKRGNRETAKMPDPQSQSPEPESEAEACFHKAIEIARQQQAKSLELRAVMSLVRLRQRQALQQGAKRKIAGKRGSVEVRKPEERPSLPASQHPSRTLVEAHRMLTEVYNWFTEGFDTKDLQEAKTLLESLESSV